MAVAPRPKHKNNRPPVLGRLNKYLATDERGKREETLFMDGHGNAITHEIATHQAGGYTATHWHGFIAPSVYECDDLTKRYGGDKQKAAVETARILASRIQKDMNTERPPNIAIHFEKDKDGKDRWHYHFVGEGKPKGKIYGKEGLLQKTWDREFFTERKAIVNWDEHKAYKETRENLKTVQTEMRGLFKARSEALRAEADPKKKNEIRRSFDQREISLITQRHLLETKAANHRYAARNDFGSSAHNAELKKIDSRKSLLLKRMTVRNMDHRRIKAVNKSVGWGISAGKRGAKKCISLVSDAARRATQQLSKATRQQSKDSTVRKLEGALQHPTGLAKTGAFRLVSRTSMTATNIGLQGAKSAALATAKASIATGKASFQLGIGIVFAPVTKGQSMKQGVKDALFTMKDGAKDASKEGEKGIKGVLKEAAKGSKDAAKDVTHTIGSAGMGMLPKQVQHLTRTGIEAGKTAVKTAVNIVTLSPISAVKTLAIGSIETAKEASGVLIQTAKLPAALALPVKAVEMVPIVGLVAKAGRITAEIGHGLVKTVQEFER